MFNTIKTERDPQKRSRMWNYVAGLSSGYVLTFATIAVSLWLTPFTLSFLDREQYAIFTLTGDVLMWLALLDLGVTAGLRAQAAQLSGRPDKEKLDRLASTAFFTQNFVVVAVLLGGCALAWAFPHFFHVRPELQRDSVILVGLMVLGLCVTMATQTFSALLVANQQMHVDNGISLLNLTIRSVLTVVLLKAGWGLYSLAAANVAARVTSSTLAVVRTFRTLPGLRIRRSLMSWDVLKQIGHLGIWFSLGTLAGIVNSSLDGLMTGKIVSVSTVTTLALTGRLYSLSKILLGQITDTARPMLGQMLGQKDQVLALRTYRHLFTLSTGIAVVAATSIWAGNGSFVTRWVGPGNYGGIELDIALGLNLIFFAWLLPNRATLTAGLIVRAPVICRIIEGVVNLGLSVLLGMRYGVFGVVIASAIACLVSSWWYLPLLTARMFGRPFLRFIWDDAARVLVLMACLFPIAFFVQHVAVRISGFTGAAFGIVATGLTGVALIWVLLLDAELRNKGLSVINRIVSFKKPSLEVE